MKLKLTTQVARPPQQVWDGFTEDLFLKLAPPFPRARLLRFEGSTTGCWVEVELHFLFFKQTWQSLIIEHGQDEQSIWFVDEGRQLPFFLSSWRHRHVIATSGSGSQIIDDIQYRSPSRWLDYLLLPAMWLQFAYRKPIYRRAFAIKG